MLSFPDATRQFNSSLSSLQRYSPVQQCAQQHVLLRGVYLEAEPSPIRSSLGSMEPSRNNLNHEPNVARVN